MTTQVRTQTGMETFDFQAMAVIYYNSKADANKQISSYDDLSMVSPATVRAKQRAAALEQALFLESLGAKYDTPIFEGLSKEKDHSKDATSDATPSQDPTASSPSLGSVQSNTSETSTTVESAHHITKINNKLRKLHHKANNLINHPGQGVAGAVTKIFDRITQVTTLATSVPVPKKVQNNVQRECFQVVIKLYTHLPSLAINAGCRKEFRAVIKNKQSFVKKDDWKDFVADYLNIMTTSGSADSRVKTAMEQLAAVKKPTAAPINDTATATAADACEHHVLGGYVHPLNAAPLNAPPANTHSATTYNNNNDDFSFDDN